MRTFELPTMVWICAVIPGMLLTRSAATAADDTTKGPNDAASITFSVDSADLGKALRRTVHATGSTKTEQFDWNVILLEGSSRLLTLVATDGRRMVVAELPVKSAQAGAGGPVVCSLTTDAARVISESLKEGNQQVEMRLTANEIAITSGPKQLRLPTERPRFPDWRRVRPKPEGAAQFMIDADALLLALVRAEPDSSNERHVISFSLAPGKLTVQAFPDAQQAITTSVPVKYQGDVRQVRFDPRYMTSFVCLIESTERLAVSVRGPNEPITLSAGDFYQLVVMPVAGK